MYMYLTSELMPSERQHCRGYSSKAGLLGVYQNKIRTQNTDKPGRSLPAESWFLSRALTIENNVIRALPAGLHAREESSGKYQPGTSEDSWAGMVGDEKVPQKFQLKDRSEGREGK